MTSDSSAEGAIHSHAFSVHYSPMPQSLSKVIIHTIFRTKNREPSLDSATRPRMHAYLATICRDLGDEAFCVGHVHAVTTLPRTLSQAELIEQIKKPSSKWIKAFGVAIEAFPGNAAMQHFRRAQATLKLCCNTCRDEKSTIVLTLFKTSTESLLRRHNIEFDEQYVWD